MKSISTVLGTAAAVALMATVPASAQVQPQRPERPYRGIFASGTSDSGQTLVAQGSLSGGYDDNLLAAATQQSQPSVRGDGGTLGQFSGQLNYGWNASRAALNAGVGTSVRYYPSFEEELVKTYNASIGGSVQVLTKPSVTLRQNATYQPYTFLSSDEIGFGMPIGFSSSPEIDYVALTDQYLAVDGGIDVRHQLSRRVRLDAGYSYLTTERLSQEFLRQMGRAAVSLGLTRDLDLRLGYRRTESRYDDRVVTAQNPDIGLDFHKALSLTRRTSLTFGVGTEGTTYRDTTRFRATGNANVTHEIGRSWQLDGSYQRGTFFLESLREPVFADSVRVALGGLVTRRLQVTATAGATVGQASFNAGSSIDSYRGSVSTSIALTRFMNVGVDYAYYRYELDPTLIVEAGAASEINRQSIRAHVTLWAPLLNSRRTNASR